VQIDPTKPMFEFNQASSPFVPLTRDDVETPAGGGGATRAAGGVVLERRVAPGDRSGPGGWTTRCG
jgi:hypothetical protein